MAEWRSHSLVFVHFTLTLSPHCIPFYARRYAVKPKKIAEAAYLNLCHKGNTTRSNRQKKKNVAVAPQVRVNTNVRAFAS